MGRSVSNQSVQRKKNWFPHVDIIFLYFLLVQTKQLPNARSRASQGPHEASLCCNRDCLPWGQSWYLPQAVPSLTLRGKRKWFLGLWAAVFFLKQLACSFQPYQITITASPASVRGHPICLMGVRGTLDVTIACFLTIFRYISTDDSSHPLGVFWISGDRPKVLIHRFWWEACSEGDAGTADTLQRRPYGTGVSLAAFRDLQREDSLLTCRAANSKKMKLPSAAGEGLDSKKA